MRWFVSVSAMSSFNLWNPPRPLRITYVATPLYVNAMICGNFRHKFWRFWALVDMCQNRFLKIAVFDEKLENIIYSQFSVFTTIITFYPEQGLPDFSWHNIPKRAKIYHIVTKLPSGRNIFLVAREDSNLFHSQALRNLPKLGFLVWK
jgi:hypothetical protein